MQSHEDAQKLKQMYSSLRIIKANDLRKADMFGHSDPYCIVKLGTSKKARTLTTTQVMDNNPDPEWNHGPITVDWMDQKVLKFEVWDKDMVGPGEKLGQAFVKKTDCTQGFHSDLHLGDGNGTLTVELAPAGYKQRPDGTLFFDIGKVEYQPPKPKPILSVTIISAENLRGVNLFGGKSDPYVICTLSDKKQFRTAVVNENLNPTWNHGPVEFMLENEARLVFEVRDKDLIGSKPLGKKSLSREQCLKGFEGPLSLGKSNGVLNVRVKQLVCRSLRKPFKLRITIVCARDLRDADMFGHSDPYVQCKVRGKLLFQTDVIWDNPNPVWNHPPEDIEIVDPKDLKFDVYDKDLIGQGDFLGTAMLSAQMCDAGFEGELSLGVDNGFLAVKVQRLGQTDALHEAGQRSVADVGLAVVDEVRSKSPDTWARDGASSQSSPLRTPLLANGSPGRRSGAAQQDGSGNSLGCAAFLATGAGSDCSLGVTLERIRSKIREYVSPASHSG